MLIFQKLWDIIWNIFRKYGRLAQLVELPLDVRKVGDSSSSSSTRGAVPAIAGAALFFAQKQKHNKQPPSLRRAAVFLSILLFIDYLDLFFLADENHSSACAQCQDCQCSSDHAAVSGSGTVAIRHRLAFRFFRRNPCIFFSSLWRFSIGKIPFDMSITLP